MPSGNVPTSPTSPSADTPQKEHCTGKMQRQMSYDPTEYVQRARVTKAAPPKPAANPLQFVAIKPCNLYQSAQDQLKRADEVKKVKEIVKEEPEDWQSNLDNWKSGRRKRVEHIIDRVVEAKKLEMDELDRNRKKSKTFSEMMEERESKGRKCSLPVYNDDEDANDFNGFGYQAGDTINGIGSVSEDYENQSVNSDNTLDSDKNRFIDGNRNHHESYRRDSESSPGFDDNTSNSTLSAASPDPVYSSSYNSNGSRTQITTLTSNFSRVSVESWAEKHHAPPSSNHLKPKPRLTPKIEGHLASYETKFNDSNADQDEHNANVNVDKIDLPKIDISSRRELFEKEQKAQFNRSNDTKKSPILLTENAEAPASIKERLSHLEKRNDEPKEIMPTKPNRYSGDFSGVRERFSHTDNGQFVTIEPKAPKIDVPVVPLKERLISLESSMVNETPKSNGKLEHRTKKMAEPKSITLNKVDDESNLKVIDNNNESTTSSPIHVDESHHMKDDEDSGINSDDLQSSLASQQSQPQQMVDECNVISRPVVMAVPRNEKPNEPVPAARKPEVMPRRQITPDLVKITTNSNIEDDLLQSQDEIDDEADNSVSLQSISPTSTTKNFLNLTIKSVLVDSHDIVKASTISSPPTPSFISTTTTTLVMENQSIECAISSGQAAAHNDFDRIVDNNNHKPVENHILTVDVEPILTETLKNNGTNNTIIDNEIAIEKPPSSKRIDHMHISTLSNNKIDDEQFVSNTTTTTENKSHTTTTSVDNVDGNHNEIESIQLKNERIKCQIVGVLEKNKIDVVSSNASNENQSLSKCANKNQCKSPSKTKNIFDFIKRNLLNEPTSTTESIDNEPNDQCSNFYISLNETQQPTEIDQLLDDELDKLNNETDVK